MPTYGTSARALAGRVRSSVREYWPFYLMGGFILILSLTVIRGLGWQWWAIITATQPNQPVVSAPATSRQPAPAAPGAVPAAAPAPAVKRPLPPTDEPPPRNTTDARGVQYDAFGVAVMGLDVDPNGVYNVPPGRQVRIGGPNGPLYDVQPDGKITPATQIKQWP